METMNLRRSLSPLHAECEALIWVMECMKTLQFSDVVFATDCSQLVKMVSTPEEFPAFSTHMEEFRRSKTFFSNFRIRHIPRAQNSMADKLVRGTMSFPSAILYVDSTPLVWFSEPRGPTTYFRFCCQKTIISTSYFTFYFYSIFIINMTLNITCLVCSIHSFFVGSYYF